MLKINGDGLEVHGPGVGYGVLLKRDKLDCKIRIAYTFNFGGPYAFSNDRLLSESLSEFRGN